MDHAQMDHAAMGHERIDPQSEQPASALPRTPIPPVTPEDRAAAFPAVHPHTMHGMDAHHYLLFNQLETRHADGNNSLAWDFSGWYGTDIDRIRFRSEGEHVDKGMESANLELFYSHAVSRWWDAMVGIRHDFGQGPARTFAAIGLLGLAPYKFEVEATGYVGESSQTGLGLEIEYETLFSNRLIGQWLVEVEAWGKDDIEHGIGSGLSTLEAGFRLRYEFTRQFAPYIGVTWQRAYGGTADLRRVSGREIEDTRLLLGLRTWF